MLTEFKRPLTYEDYAVCERLEAILLELRALQVPLHAIVQHLRAPAAEAQRRLERPNDAEQQIAVAKYHEMRRLEAEARQKIEDMKYPELRPSGAAKP